MSSSKSRTLKQNRRYQRTHVTTACGLELPFLNNGGRHDFMALPYQIPRCNTSGFNVPFRDHGGRPDHIERQRRQHYVRGRRPRAPDPERRPGARYALASRGMTASVPRPWRRGRSSPLSKSGRATTGSRAARARILSSAFRAATRSSGRPGRRGPGRRRHGYGRWS